MSEGGNPYQASSAGLVEVVPVTVPVGAGKLRRLCNFLIDTVVIYGLFFVAAIVALVLGQEQWLGWAEDISFLADLLLTATVRVVYYTLMEGVFGFSIGKLLTNTRVVDEQGRAVGLRAALLRSLCRHIPFEPFSLLLRADDEDKRGWHDSLARTWVVVRGAAAPAVPAAGGGSSPAPAGEQA